MAVHWHLRTYLQRKHGIHKATDLQKRIVQETGILISLSSLTDLMNKKPGMIRLKTMEILCTALDCKLEDFCRIGPGNIYSAKVKKLGEAHVPTCHKNREQFPDPEGYG